MNRDHIKALSDAELHSGPRQTGLVQQSGRTWKAEGSYYDLGHDNMTVYWLVNRGYLQTYVCGTVAHITDSGREVLEEHREAIARLRNMH